MPTLAREAIEKLEQLTQVQYDLTTQLNELYVAAVKLGLYDAYDLTTQLNELYVAAVKLGLYDAADFIKIRVNG